MAEQTGYDLDKLITNWGATYDPRKGDTYKMIKKKIFEPSVTETYFRKQKQEGDLYKSIFATIDSVYQAFAIPFTPKGTIDYTPWEQRIGEFKIDLMFAPDVFRNTYLAFLADVKEVDKTKWNILKWNVAEMVLPKAREEMENEIAWYGWMRTGYNAAPTVDGATLVRELASKDVASPANAAMDGIWIQIIRMVQQNLCNVINSMAWSTDPKTFCDEIEEWCYMIPEVERRLMDFLFMSDTLYRRYKIGRRIKYNLNYAQVEDLEEIEDTMMKVKKLPSMAGSQKVWTTPAMNRVRPIRSALNGKFDMQKQDRFVKHLSNHEKLITLDSPQLLYTNDLQNTITAADITARYAA